MSNVKASAKKAAGFVEEEVGEMVGNDKMANKGRELRNEGKIESGEPPMTTKPGTLHKHNA